MILNKEAVTCTPGKNDLVNTLYRYNCSDIRKPDPKGDRGYCADPACTTGWQLIYPSLNVNIMACCLPKCETHNCNGAIMINEKCMRQEAVTLDFGLTWKCKEEYYPKCPGGWVSLCTKDCKDPSKNITSWTQFGELLFCSPANCDGVMEKDGDNWAFKCYDKACYMGDFKQVFLGGPTIATSIWKCQSATCPTNRQQYDPRRNRYYCLTDPDCHTDFAEWNQGKWVCPAIQNQTPIETKIEEILVKVRNIEIKMNTLYK